MQIAREKRAFVGNFNDRSKGSREGVPGLEFDRSFGSHVLGKLPGTLKEEQDVVIEMIEIPNTNY